MGKITIVNRQIVWTWSIFHAIFHVAIWNWSNSMVPSSTWWNSNQLRSGLNLWKMDTPPVLPIPQKMRNLSIMAILAHPEINLSTGCPQSIAFSWFISGWIQWFMVDITIYRLFHCYIYISWYMVDIILYSIHGAYFMVYKPTFTSPGGPICRWRVLLLLPIHQLLGISPSKFAVVFLSKELVTTCDGSIQCGAP
jgi:hypothetical protein